MAKTDLRCSFCKKKAHDVGKLIAGRDKNLFICNNNIEICNNIVAHDAREDAKKRLSEKAVAEDWLHLPCVLCGCSGSHEPMPPWALLHVTVRREEVIGGRCLREAPLPEG